MEWRYVLFSRRLFIVFIQNYLDGSFLNLIWLLQLLVNGKIISLSLPVKLVYDSVWKPYHPGKYFHSFEFQQTMLTK